MRHSIAVPAKFHRPDGVLQFFAGGDADLGLDQVHASDHLRDRMLHLNARVHFDEVERAVFVHQEFDRAGVACSRSFSARPRHLPAQFRRAASE